MRPIKQQQRTSERSGASDRERRVETACMAILLHDMSRRARRGSGQSQTPPRPRVARNGFTGFRVSHSSAVACYIGSRFSCNFEGWNSSVAL